MSNAPRLTRNTARIANVLIISAASEYIRVCDHRNAAFQRCNVTAAEKSYATLPYAGYARAMPVISMICTRGVLLRKSTGLGILFRIQNMVDDRSVF
jgi:hypothetical protein